MKACEVLKALRISRQSLWLYHKKGMIKSETLPSGKYSYNEEDVFRLLNKEVPIKEV